MPAPVEYSAPTGTGQAREGGENNGNRLRRDLRPPVMRARTKNDPARTNLPERNSAGPRPTDRGKHSISCLPLPTQERKVLCQDIGKGFVS